ncbi:MAG: DUF6326 family protein [Candidatus Bathyarchaeota archaeon]|nr:DUF6326 family protein [Candidatus Bathyarchaeota archaeon]MDH5747042.1 DUF6326 family protein [Candidatus Bathyarchaeota archaeon]
MENLALKIKLAALWLFLAVGFTAFVLLALMMPGGIEQIIAGEIEGMGPISEGLLLFFAVFWLIPLTMAFLSLTLKDSANRWANIIVGIVWAAIGILDLGDTLSRGWLTLALVAFSKTVAAALIVWYAWKWPKQDEQKPT